MRVLLIPDNTQWIIGQIAAYTKRYLEAAGHSTVIVSSQWAKHNREALRKLMAWSNLTHCLSPMDSDYIASMRSGKEVLIATLHHYYPEGGVALPGFRKVDWLWVPAAGWKALLERQGHEPEKVWIEPYPLDCSIFHPPEASSRRKTRHALGIRDDQFVMGFFFKEKKGFIKGSDILGEVFSLLRQREKGDALCGLFSGGHYADSGQMIRRSGVPIVDLGFRADGSDLPGLFGAMDCYIVSSRCEGGPYPAFEAMASGVPLVSTKVGMVGDLPCHAGEELFWPVDIANPEQIADAVDAIRKSPDEAHARTARARQWVLDQLDWSRRGPELVTSYERVLTLYRQSVNGEPDSSPPLELPEDWLRKVEKDSIQKGSAIFADHAGKKRGTSTDDASGMGWLEEKRMVWTVRFFFRRILPLGVSPPFRLDGAFEEVVRLMDAGFLYPIIRDRKSIR